MRPVTIFTGQWADLPFEEVCRIMSEIGYEGLEIASWGDHLDLEKAAKDLEYVNEKKKILEKYNLKCWAIGTHIIGQCVCDVWDKRLDGFAPNEYAGKPEEIKKWAIRQMKYAPVAAKNLVRKLLQDSQVLRYGNIGILFLRHRTNDRRCV